jgi:hypothetical protein
MAPVSCAETNDADWRKAIACRISATYKKEKPHQRIGLELNRAQ